MAKLPTVREGPHIVITDKQKGVLKGMTLGLTVTVISIGLAISGVLERIAPTATGGPPLRDALRWDALIIACLAINIAAIARHRFFSPDDIDGSGLSRGTATVHQLQSILQNTLEQTVLAMGVHATWASTMPHAWQTAVPVGALLFVIGRILFWRGYAGGAAARSLGFTLTFYPSAAMLVIIAVHLI